MQVITKIFRRGLDHDLLLLDAVVTSSFDTIYLELGHVTWTEGTVLHKSSLTLDTSYKLQGSQVTTLLNKLL